VNVDIVNAQIILIFSNDFGIATKHKNKVTRIRTHENAVETVVICSANFHINAPMCTVVDPKTKQKLPFAIYC